MDRGDRTDHQSARRHGARVIGRPLAVVLSIVTALLIACPIAAEAALTQQQYLHQAQQGVSRSWGTSPTNLTWGNKQWHWYNRLLTGNTKNPLATIWDVVGLWESENDIALAKPTAANVRTVEHFATYAWKYHDKNITPVVGESQPKVLAYGPYPGNYNDPETFCDDNAWFGLAFMNAREVMLAAGNKPMAELYLQHALVAFNFISKYCWDAAAGGGMWWSTAHKQRSGEALGLAIDLAARLYQATSSGNAAHDAGSSPYLDDVDTWVTWANDHLLKWDGSYACGFAATPCGIDALSSQPTEVIMPHDGEGAMIAAFTTLCQTSASVPQSAYQNLPPNKTQGVGPSFRLPSDPTSWCSWAEALADHTANGVNPGGGVQDAFLPLSEGPQWDATYIRGLLTLYAYDHSAQWYNDATSTATRIYDNARDSNGLYLKGWDGSTTILDAVPGMLRTHAWSVSVFATLADVAPPG